MSKGNLAIDHILKIFCLAAKKTLEKGTRKEVRYSSTVQKIPKISLRPELGCFVQFSGDYNGLLVMNFSAVAALELYRNYMLTMGLPEAELTDNATSSEVVDTMGELTNQIMGRAMQMVEAKYDLNAKFGQPKAVYLNSAIILSLENTSGGLTMSPEAQYSDNRRIVFTIDNSRFHMEIAMERTEFVTLE
jgi:CheY-specific phosphatase CheX